MLEQLQGALQNTAQQHEVSGQESVLLVAASIEEMDIHDLETALGSCDNGDLHMVYRNLLRGSRNHLRAFVQQLRTLGLDYEPQYIDPLLFDAIVGV